MSGYALSSRARQDLKDIWHYSADQWGRDRADRYIRAIHRSFEIIAKDSRRGRSAENLRVGYRKFSVGTHVIFFRVEDEGLNIIRILHQSMDFESHL
jgi:toxin ParE1/3/4